MAFVETLTWMVDAKLEEFINFSSKVLGKKDCSFKTGLCFHEPVLQKYKNERNQGF